MASYDLWFCRYNDTLYAVTTEPGEAPNHYPRKVSGVGTTIRRVRSKGHEIVQIGILDPDMMGIE